MRIAFVAACLVASTDLVAIEWQQVKNKNGIEVYQQKLENGLIKLRAKTVADSCVDAFQTLLFDTSNATRWLSNVQSVTVLSQPSESEHFVYTQMDAPWPVKNRDMVTFSRTIRPSKEQLQIGIQAAKDVHPHKKGYIRIEEVEATWVVTQKSDKQVVIEYQAIADPAGKIPLWLGNSVAKSNVYNTFKKMKKYLPQYSCQRSE